MAYYPILVDLQDKMALVVGGGRVAQRKVEALVRFGASISIVAKKLTPTLKQLVENGIIRHLGEDFEERYLRDAFLVIVATDDRQFNHSIGDVARKRGLLVNVVDQPLDCNFIVPSILKRGELVIAISTSGNSPALAKRIRKDLQGQFGEEYGVFLRLMGLLRNEILAKGFSQEKNRELFQEIVRSDILNAISGDDWQGVRSILTDILPDDIDIEAILRAIH